MKLNIFRHAVFYFSGMFLVSCASENVRYGKNVKNTPVERINQEKIAHRFYLIGDAGNADQQSAKAILDQFKTHLDSADSNSTVIFLGDNIYPKGLPKEDGRERETAIEKLDDQINLVKNFKGKTIFIPGNHDWYSKGIIGLKEQHDYIISKLNDKSAFLPKNSCAIDSKKVTKDITLIIIDTEWFLADWDKNPGINEKCDIKTREDFFSEFESELNKNQNKTVVVALHHPLIDHGSHGGYYSLEKQIFPLENKFPLPILGTGLNLARATGGITHQDLSNANYRKLSSRLKTLLANRDNVVVVSGHDHNLQYIEDGKIRQIISGAGSKNEAAAAIGSNDFSYGNNGYAVLNISQTGDASVSYFGRENNQEKLLFQKQVLENSEYNPVIFPSEFPAETTSSVYPKSFTRKSHLYEFLWGKNYRENYSTPVKVPTLQIDTLFGGAKPGRSGGGHQTNSLRLNTPKGEYVIRALKKSGVRFLQSVAFKNQYIEEDFAGGFADQFLLDFYTSSHPFTPLAIGDLSEAVGLKHTDPTLVYVPKQNGLEKFNQNFGDELYYLEARPAETEENPLEVLGTEEVIKLLGKDEKYKIDEKNYIRARLFDMLIGDWDRHHDQWKWEQKPEGKLIYLSPIPKDRDQAFVRYDGLLTKFILDFPGLRHMQSFDEKIKNIKWFNMESYPLDLAFTTASTEEDWLREAAFIQNHLNSEIIASAFEKLPKEVQSSDIDRIKKNLEIRKNDLQKYASEYYKIVQKTVLLTGTNKKDKFAITRLPQNETEVKIYRQKKSGEELVFEKKYSKKQTKEIWMYGLGDDDQFEVNGNQSNPIKIRLLGGLNNDVYTINKGNNVHIYDYKSKKNTFNTKNGKITLSDNYDLNEYQYKKPKFNVFSTNLNLGYNPDDGVIVGLNTSWTKKGFNQNPFSSKHTLKTNYFTLSNGYEIRYEGIFPRIVGNWFYQIDAGYTDSHYIRNYFGNGNLTINNHDTFEEKYYRVRAREFYAKPSINWRKNASLFSAKLIYEGLKIEKTDNRRIAIPNIVDENVFSTNYFAGIDVGFHFENVNKNVNPSLGMKFDTQFTYRQNLNNSEKKLPTFETGLGFTHYLTKNEKLTFSTYAKAKWLLSNDYEFYQMATLGGNENLRGFRFDRFYGKRSFYQSSDLRWSIGNFRNAIVPLNVGIFGGFDYGRVWLPNEFTKKWHTSAGAGIWLNALDMVAIQTSYFLSSDEGRFIVGFGMKF